MSDILETGFKAGGVPALEADRSNFVEWMDLLSTRDVAKEFDKEDTKAAAYLKIAAGKQQ
ncbi:MAG: hypothetical protein FE78DRAFT_29325 [Acidomyces sp. 'richmondensis']|nr:MAG: hypothetical protein FE78DRAFT_29325 [Acidomyces sp. 'richmondensis']